MTKKSSISDEQVNLLKKSGFSVHCINDQDGLYAWKHSRSGASQGDWKDRQPYRKSEEQAWHDCWQYDQGTAPMKPEPDWVDQKN